MSKDGCAKKKYFDLSCKSYETMELSIPPAGNWLVPTWKQSHHWIHEDQDQILNEANLFSLHVSLIFLFLYLHFYSKQKPLTCFTDGVRQNIYIQTK